jgi:hypothetical protein
MPSALETAIELSEKGLSDSQILSEMKEMGYNSREINEAINEASIKKSIIEKPISGNDMGKGMEPSIMEKSEELEVPKPLPEQQTNYYKKSRVQQNYELPQVQSVEAGNEQTYSPQTPETQYYPAYQQMPQQPYYTEQPMQQQSIDIELVEEIAEEAASEKFNEFKNKVGDIVGFKQNTERRIEDIDGRLKRIELNLDKIQLALIGRMKEYGENVKALSGEMKNVEDSVSKILDPLIYNVKELNSLTEKIKDKTAKRAKK